VTGEREKHADGESIAVAGDESASFSEEFREHGLRVADLWMRGDDDRNVFEGDSGRLVAGVDNELSMLDAEPGGLFSDVDDAIAHRRPSENWPPCL
jgi:hypothetical protein